MTTTETRHDPLLLTPRQAAEALAISRRKLWALTNAREVACVRVGHRSVRYDPADLREYIAAQKGIAK